MAEKKKVAKIILERNYNVPLRKGWLKAPKYRRAKKAVNTLKEFLAKHMKSNDVKLGMYVNEHIWKDGIKSPPHHVKVHVTKDEEGVVKAELEGFEFKGAVQTKPKEEKATGLKGKLQEVLGKKKEDKTEEKKDDDTEKEVKEEEKTQEKKEAKTEKKEPAKEKKPAKPKKTTRKAKK